MLLEVHVICCFVLSDLAVNSYFTLKLMLEAEKLASTRCLFYGEIYFSADICYIYDQVCLVSSVFYHVPSFIRNMEHMPLERCCLDTTCGVHPVGYI